MKCPSCGKNNPDGARFCIYCHSLFKSAPSAGNKPSGSRTSGNKSSINTPVINRPVGSRKKSSDNKPLIIALMLLLLVVVIVATGLILYHSGILGKSGKKGGGGGGGGGGGFDTEDNIIIKNNADIRLTASETELRTESGTRTVYFYAESHDESEILELIDSEGNTVAAMLDDGKQDKSGDEINGDGIYTAKLDFTTFDEAAFYYYAVNTSRSHASDILKITVIAPLTDEELENNSLVDSVLVYILSHPDYASMSHGQKSEFILECLGELVEEKLIKENTIHINEERCLISFQYASGVMGGISYDSNLEGENSTPSYVSASANIPASSLSSTNARPYSKNYDALLVYATDGLQSARYPVVTELANDWTRRGLSTKLETNATIDTMKNLAGLKFICFDNHGMFFEVLHQPDDFLKWFSRRNSSKIDTINTPALFLHESPTPEKDRLYSNDLKTGRVIKMNGGYGITSAFFDYYYDEDDLKDSIIYFCCCELMGAAGTEEETWSNVLLSKNVAAFVAYHNTVFSFYVYDKLSVLVPDLIEGTTINDALENAKALFGNNDSEWVTICEMSFDPHVHKAYPVLRGNKKAKLDLN